jgi:radical SAM protein (TIGR01212 family)
VSYYYSYNSYLQKKFGCRVYKISIDGGFTCPNRDGSKGVSGCIFCDERGSSARTNPLSASVRTQVLRNIVTRQQRYGAKKFIAYFQSFSNTYAPVATLQKTYNEAIASHPDIVGLSIATRADCVDKEKLALIKSYQKTLDLVTIEYGMQTIHDVTLDRIGRKETHSDFMRALEQTQQMEIDHCAHVILGLPGETHAMMMETAKQIAACRIQGVKIHILVAMRNTRLGCWFEQGLWGAPEMLETVSLICDFLERLAPDCIIYRIGGNGHPLHGLAPAWVWQNKKEFHQALESEFQRRGTRQGGKS